MFYAAHFCRQAPSMGNAIDYIDQMSLRVPVLTSWDTDCDQIKSSESGPKRFASIYCALIGRESLLTAHNLVIYYLSLPQILKDNDDWWQRDERRMKKCFASDIAIYIAHRTQRDHMNVLGYFLLVLDLVPLILVPCRASGPAEIILVIGSPQTHGTAWRNFMRDPRSSVKYLPCHLNV